MIKKISNIQDADKRLREREILESKNEHEYDHVDEAENKDENEDAPEKNIDNEIEKEIQYYSEENDDEPEPDGSGDSEDDDEKLDSDVLKGAIPCNTRPQASAARGECGGISIINSNCGKRIELSKKVLASLNEPENVQLFFK